MSVEIVNVEFFQLQAAKHITETIIPSLEGDLGVELTQEQREGLEASIFAEIENSLNRFANGEDADQEEEAPPKKTVKKAAPKKTAPKAVTKAKAAPAKKTAKAAPAKKTVTKAKTAPAKKKAPAKPKDYSKMKVEDLKAELESRDLVKTGKKDDLIARLEAHDAGGEDAPKPKSKSSKKAVAKAAAGPVAQENAWGNSEETETGIIFVKLPVGTGGREVPVAVGVQDTEAEEDAAGLASVMPLTEEMIATCEEQKWRYLTDEYMDMLTEQEHELAGELAAVRARGGDVEATEADVEEEEE